MMINVHGTYKFVDMINFAIIITLCFLLQGCTYGLWRAALSRNVEISGIKGEVVFENYQSKEARYLLVLYGRFFGLSMSPGPYCYVIPIENGKIDDLFTYPGPCRNIDEIFDNISTEKLERLQRFEFTQTSHEVGMALYAREGVKHRDGIKFGRPYPVKSGLSIIPFITQDMTTSSIIRDGNDSLTPPFDPRCHFLILPSKQKRPVSDRITSTLGAVIGTPFAAFCDIMLIPGYILEPSEFIRSAFL